jgi:hypothetical protein
VSERSAEITVFEKDGGSLNKHIELLDGKIVNDSSDCRMANGIARRVKIDLDNMQALADIINNFSPREAYALGRLKDGLLGRVRVVRAGKLNGADDPSTIARTKHYLVFGEGEPGLALLDVDLKGMPEDAKRPMKEAGSVWTVLGEVIRPLKSVAFVWRASTSSGLRNQETGEPYPDSGGFHIVIPVVDAADIPRFLSDLHDRLWLAGLGWGMVSAGGSFLERSLVDRTVGSPERLIFEGPPIIEPPLEQAPRPTRAQDGDILDTKTACPPLTGAEKAEVQKLKDAERDRLKPALDKARAEWSEAHVKRMVAAGVSRADAKARVDHWIDTHELSGDFPLPFDDPKLAGATVADVIAAPDKYVGKTLSDPFEGIAYGRRMAIVYRRENGSLFIKSYAHGGAPYELKAASDLRPTIMLRVGETKRAVDELEALLIASDLGLYQRGGLIVSTGFAKLLTWDGKTVLGKIIEERGEHALCEDAETIAKFVKFDKRQAKLVPAAAPMGLIRTLKDRKHRLRLPVLVGVVNCPSISATGELLDQPGYDPKTGVLYDPLGVVFPPVPHRPSKQEAKTALRRILRLFRTFDFVSEDDRAVALSETFTAVARRGLPFAPLHGFDGPVAGSGKSSIVDIASILATGHEAPVIAQGKNADEFEKRLSTALMRGDPIIAIDNCSQPLEGDLLNQALTQPFLDLRILGFSKSLRTQAKALISGTGNNLTVVGDLTRRSLVGRLDPKCERPELREFNYDPIADAKENRGELVVAVLTVLRAYHGAGRPKRPKPALQSFVPWSNMVRGALIWLGQGDPVKTMDRLRKTDPITASLKAALAVWRDVFGDNPTTVFAAVEAANETLPTTRGQSPTFAHPFLRAALYDVAGRSGAVDTHSLGKWLGKHEDRMVNIGDDQATDFAKFKKTGKLHGLQQWQVVTRPPQGGEGG